MLGSYQNRQLHEEAEEQLGLEVTSTRLEPFVFVLVDLSSLYRRGVKVLTRYDVVYAVDDF